MHPPPSTAWPNFTLKTEHTPESRYYSVYSVEEGSRQEGTPPPKNVSHVVVTVHLATVLMLLFSSPYVVSSMRGEGERPMRVGSIYSSQ